MCLYLQAEKLKQEQDLLLKRQWELESMESDRKATEAERKKKEFG